MNNDSREPSYGRRRADVVNHYIAKGAGIIGVPIAIFLPWISFQLGRVETMVETCACQNIQSPSVVEETIDKLLLPNVLKGIGDK